ncbi:hypothetical protein CKO51_08670 [Rhodopirellula sp. SM50]|nr:hypothetical protein CKO51_08670 [Rhodopirellula sp. SM50]
MSRFDRYAVDSAEEDKPTPVDPNADNRRLKCRPLIGILNFPWRFRSSTLIVNGDAQAVVAADRVNQVVHRRRRVEFVFEIRSIAPTR